MKPKKKERTIQKSTSTAQTDHHHGDEGNKERPSQQRSKLTTSRAANKNENLGVTHRKSSYKTTSDLHQLQQNTDSTTSTSKITTAVIEEHDDGRAPPAVLIAKSWCRPKVGDKALSTEMLHCNTLRKSSSSVAAIASGGDEGARRRGPTPGESRVIGAENSASQQQIIQSLEQSFNFPPGGLLAGSQTSRLDGLTPEIVHILTTLVMNGTSRTTHPGQLRQSLLPGQAFMGASPVLARPPELGFQWKNIQLNPATSSPSPLSHLSLSQQSPFADIPRPQSPAEVFLQQKLSSLIVQLGHRAPQTNHRMNVPSTIWHQNTQEQQDFRSQLDTLLQTVGSSTSMAQSNRWISDLATTSITGEGSSIFKQSQAVAVGDHQLCSSNLDETTTDVISTKQDKERNPSTSSHPPASLVASEQKMEALERTKVFTPNYPGATSMTRTTSRIVLPCGARGMPPEHNFQNAFLVIDSQTQHGDDLMCSYRPCREGGVKFRYCSECRLPVAKRNFHQRHSHAASIRTLPRSSKPLLQGGVETTPRRRGSKESGWTTTTQQEDATSTEQQARTRTIMPHDQQQDEEEGFVDHCHPKKVDDEKQSHQPQHNKQNKPPRGAAGADRGPQTLASVPGGTEVLTVNASSLLVREREWAELLHKRPPSSDTDAISNWLLEVMSISEFPQSPNVKIDDSMTEMDRKTQRPPINHDPPNDSERGHDGDGERSFTTASSVSEYSISQERRSANIQKRHRSMVLNLKDERPTSRAKKKTKR